MTAVPSIDPSRFLNERLAQASPDLMRELLSFDASSDASSGQEAPVAHP
jgi:hypothetical protein